jgi:hypothetical protein
MQLGFRGARGDEEKTKKDTLVEYPILVLCLMVVAVVSLISEFVSL